MSNLVVVKIGTSLLTNKNGRIKLSFLGRVCEEISMVKNRGWNVIVVTSGAMASGVGILKGTPHSIMERSVFSCVGMVPLMNYYRDFLGVFGIISAQALLTWRDFDNIEAKELTWRNLGELLASGVVPIVNENDLTATEELSFGDNDQLAAKLAVLMKADKFVILSDVDGFYNKDPQQFKDATRFPIIEEVTPEIQSYAADKLSGNSLGGMRSKLDAAKFATENGIETIITSGIEVRNTLFRIVLNDELLGTKFLAER